MDDVVVLPGLRPFSASVHHTLFFPFACSILAKETLLSYLVKHHRLCIANVSAGGRPPDHRSILQRRGNHHGSKVLFSGNAAIESQHERASRRCVHA
jgi:hypothetical protein